MATYVVAWCTVRTLVLRTCRSNWPLPLARSIARLIKYLCRSTHDFSERVASYDEFISLASCNLRKTHTPTLHTYYYYEYTEAKSLFISSSHPSIPCMSEALGTCCMRIWIRQSLNGWSTILSHHLHVRTEKRHWSSIIRGNDFCTTPVAQPEQILQTIL